MMAPLLLAVVNALPGLIQSGAQVIEMVTHAGKQPTNTPAEDYVSKALNVLPTLISTGVDVYGLVTETRDVVARMVAENRGPTPEERTAQSARMLALDKAFDAAAHGPGA